MAHEGRQRATERLEKAREGFAKGLVVIILSILYIHVP